MALLRCTFVGAYWGIVLVFGTFVQSQEPESKPKSKLDTALEAASQTGRPVLIVGARETCGLCKAFMSELQTDPKARAVTSQFVALKVDIDDAAEWRPVARQYPYKGGLLPIILVVRADGEQIYGNAGAPPQAAPFLFEQAKKAGTILNKKQLDQLQATMQKAQEFVKAGKVDQAVPLMKRFLGSGSYAAPAVELQKLADELSAAGKLALEAAEKSAGEPNLEAALAFAEAQRLYGDLPEVGTAIKDKQKELRKDENWGNLLSQAELLSKGQAYAADGNIRQALAMFDRLLEKHPDTTSAKQASEQIAQLNADAKTPTTTSSPSSTKPTTKPASADVKRAASFLRFGKTFHSKDADKAKKYYEKAIEAAPDSEEAAEAKKLLEELS